ncbi:hypothetical protein CLV30_101409 [Haloactinopolyspora alba]|uniref:Uncharacterized protein n=1 Tax=Haloactinopolyspora alba TaxID=648780 RepID=A0A2P8EG42_9ACTN|nr:hypothetical protein CLV30_101409 [Haloactinopolyspora alba]
MTATAGNGRVVREFLRNHPVNDDFASDVAAARDTVADEVSATWP